MNTLEQRAKISEEVKKYMERNWVSCGIPSHIMASEESVNHVVNIGTSLMMEKAGIGHAPGSFVKAVIDNDLYGAITRADSVNRSVLPFYVTMLNNLPVTV